MSLIIPYAGGEVVVTAEAFDLPRYRADSADNIVGPGEELYLEDEGYAPSSRHRVTVRKDETPLASLVLLAGGGASGVHAHSAVVRGEECYVAVGPFICALTLPALKVLWFTRADEATCFGVYDAPGYASLISHGEIGITRLSYAGEVIWSAAGADIFSEGFELFEHHVEAVDFNGVRYRFGLKTGKFCAR